MKIVWLATSILLTSIACNSISKIQDEGMSSLEAGYHTAGFLISGKPYLGVASVRQDLVEPFRFTVLGIGSGEVRINPEPCAVSQARRFSDSSDTEFTITHGDVDTCLIQITVQPDPISKGKIQLPLTGLIALSYTDLDENPSHLLFASQSQLGRTERVVLPAPFDEFRVVARGCGVKAKRRHLNTNALNFDLKGRERVCILHGFVRDETRKVLDVVIQGISTRYQQGYEPLAAPKIELNGNWFGPRIKVLPHPSVNRIATKNGIIRGITSKGRAFYCTINEKGDSECL